MIGTRSNPAHQRLNRSVRCTLLGLVGLLAACTSAPKPAAPGERGAPLGLEALWWIVDDSINDRMYFETLGEALLPYVGRPTGIPDDQIERWRANGLRVVAVPVADLDLLHDRLRCVGQTREQWLGVVPTWTPIAGGVPFEQRWTLRLDNGAIELQPGQVRLLCRAWFVPVEPPLDSGEVALPMAAGLSLDLLPQHAETTRETLAQAYGLDPHPQPADTGVNFTRLALHFTSQGRDALVILPEDPSVEWKPLPPGTPRVLPTPGQTTATVEVPSGPSPDVSSSGSEDRTQSQAATAGPGPLPFHIPSLGEAMLSDVEGRGLSRRLVVVLVPRVPASFELLSR
jgi:hypothetical protein